MGNMNDSFIRKSKILKPLLSEAKNEFEHMEISLQQIENNLSDEIKKKKFEIIKNEHERSINALMNVAERIGVIEDVLYELMRLGLIPKKNVFGSGFNPYLKND